MNGDGAMTRARPRVGVILDLHGGRLPAHGLDVEAGQVVGALPLLLVGGHVLHDEGHPASENKHAATNHGSGVK